MKQPNQAEISKFEDLPKNIEAGINRPNEFEVSLDGYEGPIDALLTLAQKQKVDLARISILALAEQYIAFITKARQMRLEIAADYLVMAAWLAYLKSRLLLPSPIDDGQPSGEELAARLQHQLRRLEAMRHAAETLMSRERLGVDVFPRGDPEGIKIIRKSRYECNLYDFLIAYVGQIDRTEVRFITTRPPDILSIEKAIRHLSTILGNMPDWANLEAFLPEKVTKGIELRSSLASTFSAALELAKRERLSLRQGQVFGPVYIKETSKK